jgi:hypothetical protein
MQLSRHFQIIIASLGIALSTTACIARINSQPAQVQSEKSMFRFEDYETGEEAQKQLESLIPIGTSVDEFVELMKRVGAECRDYSNEKTGEKGVACEYGQPVTFATSYTWRATADINDGRKIESIEVYRQISAL